MTRVLHLSDLHLLEDPGGVVYGALPDRTLTDVVRAAADHGPFDAVVATGDVTDDGRPPGYARARRLLESVAPVVRWTPGNHDARSAMAHGSCLDRVARLGRWDLVCVDSHWPGRAAGRLLGEELVALAQHLESARARHVVVAMHHPPVGVCPNPDCNLEGADRLLELVAHFPNVHCAISGHVHRPFDDSRGHLRLLGAPSTCVGMHHHACHDGRSASTEPPFTDEAPAARILDLHEDGAVSTWLVPA